MGSHATRTKNGAPGTGTAHARHRRAQPSTVTGMKVSLAVLGRPLLELCVDRHAPGAGPETEPETEPERRIGFHGGSGLYAERAEPTGEMGSLETPYGRMRDR